VRRWQALVIAGVFYAGAFIALDGGGLHELLGVMLAGFGGGVIGFFEAVARDR
jgi:hypothetical protein